MGSSKVRKFLQTSAGCPPPEASFLAQPGPPEKTYPSWLSLMDSDQLITAKTSLGVHFLTDIMWPSGSSQVEHPPHRGAVTIPSYPAPSFPQLLLSLSVSLGDEQVLLT